MKVTIPVGMWDTAKKEAEIRYNRGVKVRSSNQNRGGKDLEMLIDISGVIGELLIGYILQAMYEKVESFVYDHVNFKNPDFILNDLIKIDVKTVPDGDQRKFLIITKRAHEDPAKAVDFYIPVKILNIKEVEIYNPISSLVVSSWPNNERICRFEEGHCMELSKLADTNLNKMKYTLDLKELFDKI
jgi:hypothetical protein